MKTLHWAAVYNVIWGTLVILFPNQFFDLFGMERPNYPEIWQCVGMIVGVYGVGYWLAAQDPIKHYPIVLVGFLGKVFGPIGFIGAFVTERFPLSFGINILFNDLIWWIPFFQILKEKYKRDKTFWS
jgi:small multidrug resistance pump